MKLAHIKIENLLGIRRADIALDAPATVIAGANGAGKSSIAECLRLALLGEPERVSLKSEYGQLVHQGAKGGSVEVRGDEPILVRISAAGKIDDSAKGRDPEPALQYVLDPARFARSTADQRRSFLFSLMRVSLDHASIGKRLLARGCDAVKVDSLAPILRAGFDSAHKEAAKRATEAKGSWRATTGETWGSQKGASWSAPLPDFREEDAAELMGLDKAIGALEVQLGDAQKRLGIAEHAAQQAERHAATVKHLRETAKTFAYHADLVNRSQQDVSNAKAALEDAQRRAGTKPPEAKTQLPCPACGAILADSDDGESLVLWTEPLPTPHDPEAAAAIPDRTKAVRTYETVLARHRANLDQADQAAKQLKAIEGMTPETVDPEPIKQTVNTLRAQIGERRHRQAALKKAHDELDAAGERTKRAKVYHRDITEWSAIADALAPDGIPGELLAEALKPINDRLAQSAMDSTWQPVTIDAEMTIRYGGRVYRLCSESERWRIDAMIAEAISHLSDLKCLVLDRMDVLDIPGRSALLSWLDVLAEQQEIETAVVLATLKSPVQWDSEYVRSAWIERGEIIGREAGAA